MILTTRDLTQRWQVTRLVVAATVIAAAATAAAPSASAHTDLVATNPSSSAVLDRAPDEVRLTFSEEMDPALSFVSLSLPGEQARPLPVVAGDTPTEVVATLGDASSPEVGTGETGEQLYSVRYRVTSVDGHPVGGGFTFTVVPPPANPAPTPRPETSGRATGPTPTEAVAPGATSGGPAAGNPSAGVSTNEVTGTDDVDDEGWIGLSVLVPLLIILFVVVMAIVVSTARIFRPDDELEEPHEPEEHTEPEEHDQPTQADQPRRSASPGDGPSASVSSS